MGLGAIPLQQGVYDFPTRPDSSIPAANMSELPAPASSSHISVCQTCSDHVAALLAGVPTFDSPAGVPSCGMATFFESLSDEQRVMFNNLTFRDAMLGATSEPRFAHSRVCANAAPAANGCRPLRPERAALALWATPVHASSMHDGGVDGR